MFRIRHLVASGFCCFFLLATADASTVWYVNAAASGANTGTTWQNAFTSLQSALVAASSGDEIWIAAGTYRPSVQSPTGRRYETFVIRRDLSIYGGFAGTEADRASRCGGPTVLSGDLLGDDDGANNRLDNCYRIMLLDSLVSLVVDGLTFTAGGGIRQYQGSLVVRNCRFFRTSDRGLFAYGDIAHLAIENCTFTECSPSGAALLSCSFLMTGCVFERNEYTSGWGGAVCCFGSLNVAYRIEIRDCRFAQNRASRGGGALYCDGALTTLYLTDCVVEDNVAPIAGGGLYLVRPATYLRNCTFSRNQTTSEEPDGGGAVIYENAPGLHVSDCTFQDNLSWRGGGLRMHQAAGDVVNCRFFNNVARETGGGIYGRLSTVRATNCLFIANQATSGGALMNNESAGILTHCTLANNSGSGVANWASGEGCDLRISSSILWGNHDSQRFGEDAQLFAGSAATLSVQNSRIQNWTGRYGGLGNSGEDPLLAPDGRLLPASPCIDAGDNAAVPADVNDVDSDGDLDEPVPLDAYGNPRFVNAPQAPDGLPGGPPQVDIGAVEYIEDCNRNGVFDACELNCGQPGGACDVPGCGTASDCDGDALPDSCEPDTDSDGQVNDCDPDDDADGLADEQDNCPLGANRQQEDEDGDGTGDACDPCPGTVLGAPLRSPGCPVPVYGDMNGDGDVDQEDFGAFQICIAAPRSDPACADAVLDGDNDVDFADVAIFARCFGGVGVPAAPSCFRPNP